jgi:hypothetical protein
VADCATTANDKKDKKDKRDAKIPATKEARGNMSRRPKKVDCCRKQNIDDFAAKSLKSQP